MSGFLKRTKTVNPAGGVNPASSPNVSQYGWTSYDAGNVNQIIEYVNLAQLAAQSAKDSADYVQGKIGELEDTLDYLEDFLENSGPIFANIEAIYKDIVQKHTEVKSMHVDIRAWNITAMQAATDSHNSALESHGEAVKSEVSAEASKVSADASKVSEVGSKSWYDKSKELYDDLKEGQVYQGTWNPMTNAYPVKPATNSVWDVSLPSGTSSHTFDNKEWRSGDRLLFALATGMFEQLAVGGGVDSVNGKTGAVTLTATDVGAIPTTGGQFSGSVRIKPTLEVRDDAEAYGARVAIASGSHVYYQGGKIDGDVDDQKISISGWYGKPLTYFRIMVKEGTFPYINVGGTDHRIYHQGFKPTAADIGALGNTGTQTLNGELRAVKFIASDQYGFVSALRPYQGMFTGNNANDRRTIIGGGGDAVGDGLGSVLIRPNGITDTAGVTLFSADGTISNSNAPTIAAHLTNKGYVDSSVKVVNDKIDAISPDTLNAMPKSGGDFTGPFGVKAATKSAMKVEDGASIRYNDGVGSWFHNYASGNTLLWGGGNDGNLPVMQLASDGSIVTEGAQYAKVAHVAQSRNQNTWIGAEAPEDGAPYISSKTAAESAPSVAMRFGQTEVSVESDKRMAAGQFRVGNDGGLKFAPTNDLSGLTWGMGVNATTREFGLHYYSNAAYAGQSWSVNSSGSHTFSGPTVSITGTTHMNQYVTISSATNNILEFHQPGHSAIMVYKPVNTGAFRIASSNGAGGEAAMIGQIDTGAAHFVGKVISNHNSNRSWNQSGNSTFYGNSSSTSPGGLNGLISHWVTVTGMASYEQGYGHISDQSGNIGNYGHALYCNDGSSYHNVWIFRNNGGQASPSGFRIEGDGRMAGKAYEGYEDHFHWMTASLAATSDANLKTVVGDSVKSALDIVNQFQFKRFVWNEEAGSVYTTRDKKLTDIGLIAQQVEEVDPSLVKTISVGGDTPTETKTLDTAAMLALAMKAIQEQQVQINELKEKLNASIQ